MYGKQKNNNLLLLQLEKPLQKHGGRLEHNETYCGSCFGAETVSLWNGFILWLPCIFGRSMLYLMVHFGFDVYFEMLNQMMLISEETPSTLENNNLKRMVKCVSQSKDYCSWVLTKLLNSQSFGASYKIVRSVVAEEDCSKVWYWSLCFLSLDLWL